MDSKEWVVKSGGQLGGVGGEIRWTVRRSGW